MDPRSDIRVELFACGEDQSWTMEQEQGAEGPRSRAKVEARAHAVVAVSDGGRVLANLIGAGREEGSTGWEQPTPVLRIRRMIRNRVHEDLARDVVRQLNPLPTLVARRVYPNAPSGTARELTTLAVRARIALTDPNLNTPARVSDDGTSSPVVGPDGRVVGGLPAAQVVEPALEPVRRGLYRQDFPAWGVRRP